MSKIKSLTTLCLSIALSAQAFASSEMADTFDFCPIPKTQMVDGKEVKVRALLAKEHKNVIPLPGMSGLDKNSSAFYLPQEQVVRIDSTKRKGGVSDESTLYDCEETLTTIKSAALSVRDTFDRNPKKRMVVDEGWYIQAFLFWQAFEKYYQKEARLIVKKNKQAEANRIAAMNDLVAEPVSIDTSKDSEDLKQISIWEKSISDVIASRVNSVEFNVDSGVLNTGFFLFDWIKTVVIDLPGWTVASLLGLPWGADAELKEDETTAIYRKSDGTEYKGRAWDLEIQYIPGSEELSGYYTREGQFNNFFRKAYLSTLDETK